VSEDVPKVQQPGAPASLRHITNPDLSHFLTGPGGWDRTPDSHADSRARD
jgi:hypothetical protein